METGVAVETGVVAGIYAGVASDDRPALETCGETGEETGAGWTWWPGHGSKKQRCDARWGGSDVQQGQAHGLQGLAGCWEHWCGERGLAEQRLQNSPITDGASKQGQPSGSNAAP